MRKWIRAAGLGGLVALAAAGCDDDATAPNVIDDAAIRAEAALVAADGMFQDLGLAQDPGLEAFGFFGMGAGSGPMGGMGGQCQHLGSGPSFQCGSMVRDGFTFTREVTFYYQNGDVQEDGFEPGTTDAIRLVVNAEGSRERSFWSASMTRSRDMLLSGLLSDAHHLNGEGHSVVSRSGNPQDGAEMTFDMVVEVEWNDVVHIQPREEHPYPESGTITRDIFVEVTRDGEIVGGRDVTAVVAFNGTQYVTLDVDGEQFEIDLAEREVMRRWGGMGGRS
jgi:hypothetical protein